MRVRRNKGRRTVLAGAVAIAIGIFSWSIVERLEQPNAPAQLVSIQQLPEYSELCPP